MTVQDSWHSAYALFLLISVVQARARHSTYTGSTHTTTTICYNEQGQRITCPFKLSALYITLIAVGSVLGVFGLACLFFKCRGRRGRNKAAPEATTADSEATVKRRWPWSRKSEKVADPEETSTLTTTGTLPEYAPQYELPPSEEAHLIIPERPIEGRTSSDSYYVAPQLAYDFRPSFESTASSVPFYPPPSYPPHSAV